MNLPVKHKDLRDMHLSFFHEVAEVVICIDLNTVDSKSVGSAG